MKRRKRVSRWILIELTGAALAILLAVTLALNPGLVEETIKTFFPHFSEALQRESRGVYRNREQGGGETGRR